MTMIERPTSENQIDRLANPELSPEARERLTRVFQDELGERALKAWKNTVTLENGDQERRVTAVMHRAGAEGLDLVIQDPAAPAALQGVEILLNGPEGKDWLILDPHNRRPLADRARVLDTETAEAVSDFIEGKGDRILTGEVVYEKDQPASSLRSRDGIGRHGMRQRRGYQGKPPSRLRR